MQRLSRGVALPCRVCLCHVDWGLKQRSFGISFIIFFTNITPSTTANVRNSGKRVHLSLRGGKYLSRLTASQLCWRLSPPTLSITTIQDNGSDEQGLGDGYPVSFLLIKMGSIHVDRPCCRRTFFACHCLSISLGILLLASTTKNGCNLRCAFDGTQHISSATGVGSKTSAGTMHLLTHFLILQVM